MDDNFAMQAAVSMVSLFVNNPQLGFHLYIISDNICQANLDRLKSLAGEYGHVMDIIDMPDLEDRMGVKLITNGLVRAAYCRLFLCELLPHDVDRLIYMDPDTLVVGNISALADILDSQAFEKYPLAACLDSKAVFKRLHGFKRNERYYNDGILLVNLRSWRENGVQEKFSGEIRRRQGRSVDADQSYINCVMPGRIMTLPPEYNVMSVYFNDYDDYLKISGYRKDEIYTESELKAAVKDPVIIHFAGDRMFRPWYKNCRHCMKEEWMKYLGKTEWKSFVPHENAPEYVISPAAALKNRMIRLLLKDPFVAGCYVRHKYGFNVRLFRE